MARGQFLPGLHKFCSHKLNFGSSGSPLGHRDVEIFFFRNCPVLSILYCSGDGLQAVLLTLQGCH